ncbi:MAG: hypothetical protein KDB61_14265, partial [Planctomycetes bacterium]|nr:hypothetical protein [Planctomycetota bacterium]
PSTRGSIQRDGSVKRSPSPLKASLAQGEFGFTPSAQANSPIAATQTGDEPVAQASLRPELDTTDISGAVEALSTPGAVHTQASEFDAEGLELATALQGDEGSPRISGFLAGILDAAECQEFEGLYQPQSSAASLLSFDRFFAQPSQEPWFGALHFQEETPAGSSETEDVAWDETPSENDSYSATLDETPFVETQDLAMVESVHDVQGDTVSFEGVGTSEEDWSMEFLDHLLAMGPASFSPVPTEEEGEFQVDELEGWLEESSDASLAQVEETDGTGPAPVTMEESSTLPVSLGLNDQGDWIVADGETTPEAPENTDFDATPSLADSDLASVDTGDWKNSVGTDLEQGATTLVEPLALETETFDTASETTSVELDDSTTDLPVLVEPTQEDFLGGDTA